MEKRGQPILQRHGSLPKKKKTSRPLNPPEPLNVTEISTLNAISVINSIRDSNPSSSGERSKDLQITQDDLDQLHSAYLLACATTKLQEERLSELEAKNEDQKKKLQSVIEKKRAYLASLIKAETAVEFLSNQTRLQQKQKEALAPILDKVL